MGHARLRLLGLMLAALAGLRATADARAQPPASSADPASQAIRVYQRYLSSMRHMSCRFTPSCSQYASEAIARYGVVEGSARAADRLMRCSESAESRYPRGANGLLVDPVDGSAGSPVAVRAPRWLLPAPDRSDIPVATSVSAGRRARLDETLEFTRSLEERGDCERASAEYQRAGTLADTIPADAWAYARIGRCYFGSADWYLADRAYLTSAMLATDHGSRSTVGYEAAASRFDAGAFAASAGLLADPELSPASGAESATASGSRIPAGGVAALAGLCAFATGDWPRAEDQLGQALRETEGSPLEPRMRALAETARRGRELPQRSARVAGALSVLVPGAGQVYCGAVRDGVRHLLFNAALIYTVASLASHEQVPAAVLVGTVALPFYIGNVLGARDAATRFDRDQRMRLLARAIEESSR